MKMKLLLSGKVESIAWASQAKILDVTPEDVCFANENKGADFQALWVSYLEEAKKSANEEKRERELCPPLKEYKNLVMNPIEG
jgi:hypothetical protein